VRRRSATGTCPERQRAHRDTPTAAAPRRAQDPLGLRVHPLDPASARALGLSSGLSVVHASGAAYEAGLREADVIVDVQGRAVSDVESFWNAVAAAQWRPTLGVWRDGRRSAMRIP
jgi:S1-C subfamily serine protease